MAWEWPSLLPKTFRIIGGQPVASPLDFSFGRVSLQDSTILKGKNDALSRHQCGGVLVAADFVLTAHHCVGFFDTIQLGRHDLLNEQEDYVTRRPKTIFSHPLANASHFRYDFALIQLDAPIDTNRLPPAILNNNPNIPNVKSNTNHADVLDLFGWGAVGWDGQHDFTYTSVPHTATVTALSNAQCNDFDLHGQFLYRDEIYSEMLCAYNQSGADACLADSGGPLTLHQTPNVLVVGIVSWGRGCAVLPGVYGRVSYVFEWLQTILCTSSASSTLPLYLQCPTSKQKQDELGDDTTNSSETVQQQPQNNASIAPSNATDKASSSRQSTTMGWTVLLLFLSILV